MKMSEEIKFRSVIAFIGGLTLVLGILFFIKVVPTEKNKLEGASECQTGWYYIEDQEKIPISLPMDMDLRGEESITIYNDKIAAENAGKHVFIKNAIYRPQIFLDDIPLYQYTDGGLERNPPELSYQICSGNINDNVKTGTLKIIYHKSNEDFVSLPMVYAGATDTIVRHLFFSNAYISVITITMLMLGFFVMIVGIVTRNQEYMYKKKLVMLGAFLMTIGTWCVTDSPLIQYLLEYSNINMYMDFFVFMFLVAPFVGYVRSITGMEKYKSLKYIIVASFCNATIQTILAIFNVSTYIKMVPATHITIVIAVLTSIFFLRKEYNTNKNREVFLCLRAFAIVGLFSVISIVMYFIIPELFYQNFFQTGVLSFVLILLWNIVSDFIESLKYKIDANIYRQLAEIDKLTSLKNRRGFDLKVSEIEKNVARYDNALLIFIDVNGLKRINDCYGHTKGDEIIIAVARCIEGAYKNHGFCYRIGGDEFCAIVENPLFSEEDAISFVDHEIEIYNQEIDNDCKLSVAIGCSYLKESNGAVKDIARWKGEADYKMYDDKKAKKFKIEINNSPIASANKE